MSGIVDFLEQRLAEDEAAAREAHPGPWVSSIEGRDHVAGSDIVLGPAADFEVHFGYTATKTSNCFRAEDATQDHIARWDPARVLAEVAAKRAVIAAVDDIGWHVEMGIGLNTTAERIGEEILERLAQPYSDHPDFEERWRLETPTQLKTKPANPEGRQ